MRPHGCFGQGLLDSPCEMMHPESYGNALAFLNHTLDDSLSGKTLVERSGKIYNPPVSQV
jgi:hypothetical protein